MIDLKEDQTNATINKIWNFQKEIERELNRGKNRNNTINNNSWSNQDRKARSKYLKNWKSELKKVDLANFYIHNKFKYKAGIAMIKENNRLIRVPVIPKCTFDKITRKWRWRYYVQTIDETINFRDFVLRSKDCLLKGKNEIRKAYNSYLLTKRANMEEYRRELRLQFENRSEDI